MHAESITTFRQLDFVIQTQILNYQKRDGKLKGLDFFGNHETIEQIQIPCYSEYPIECRRLYKELVRKEYEISFELIGHNWLSTIKPDHKTKFTSLHPIINISFIMCILKSLNLEYDIKLKYILFKKCWFLDLCEEHQIHLVTDHLRSQLDRVNRSIGDETVEKEILCVI